MDKVYVVIRVDKDNNNVVWKVYDYEQKAKEFCNEMSNNEYRFRYEDWLVK